MSTEIPIWVNGKIRWLSGIDKKTTCKDVVEVLLDKEGIDKSEAKDFTIMERWKKVERQLDENSKILKIWTHWGNEKKEVRLCLRRADNEVDSGRGSPVTSGYTPSLRKKRNRTQRNGKPFWAYKETLHPRRLAELNRFDDYLHVKTKQDNEALNNYESVNICTAYDNRVYDNANKYFNKVREYENTSSRKTSGHKSYHCSNTGKLHSTPFSENNSKRPKCCNKREYKQRLRNSENIEKLMKLILVQGATIQSQLQKLKEREEQIDSLEQERHRERIEKNGRDYLLETYLGSLKDAEVPEDVNEAENKNEIKKKENIQPDLSEAEIRNTNNSKIREKVQSWHKDKDIILFKIQNKSIRSKSESRAQQYQSEGNLKRTLSENAIAETIINYDGRSDLFQPENTKEKYENLIELKKIQNQIEMWEKVFKINKKLEKEEENLVRLHIKIKKVQNENYRIAKGNFKNCEKHEEIDPLSYSEDKTHTKINDLEKMQDEQDCATLMKNLETLKSDLEDNSKEIYKNFTRLIEEDEIVAQKRCCLSEIITNLEKTDHEYDMLNEIIAMRENPNFQQDHITPFCKENTNESFGKVSLIENELNLKKLELEVTTSPRADDLCLVSLGFPHPQDNINQRTEASVKSQESQNSMKPKIVKISFERKIQNYESSEVPEEKLPKDTNSVPTGALKSILKNRTNGFTKKCNLKNEFQKYQEISQTLEFNSDTALQQENLKMNSSYYQSRPTDTPDQIHSSYNTSYPYTISYPLYVNYPNESNQIFTEQLSKFSTNLKNVSNLKIPHPTEIAATHFSHSTIVTSKTLMHNDTDSSTSSDTSGLSSMYSSSITNEEPYVEKNYVLDTLV